MAVRRDYIKQSSEYTVSYSGMRGVDFSSNGTNAKRYRFAHLENMYKDYEGEVEGITESVPGFRKLTSCHKRIHAIYSQKDGYGKEYIVVHAKDSLYRFPVSERDSLSYLKPIATVNDTKSHAFNFGTNLFILDGSQITVIKENGEVDFIGDETSAAPYAPTTYVNGYEYEQRNLLTNKFREKYTVTAVSELAKGTDGLNYSILSAEEQTASVTGVDGSARGAVYIPSSVMIGGLSYRVTEIADSAFDSNTRITSVTLSDTVKRIGKMAFISCTSLREFVCRSSVENIDNNAFLGCFELEKIYLGSGLKRIGVSVFGACESLERIIYAADGTTFLNIETLTDLSSFTIEYGAPYTGMNVEIPIFSPAVSINSVTVDGAEFQFQAVARDGYLAAVNIVTDMPDSLNGKEIIISGEMDGAKFKKNTVGISFLPDGDASVNGRDAILGCRIAECFDGRVFLSGNPALPNTVFYTARDESGKNNPTYFGVLNYFNDGTGRFPVKSLLAVGNSLIVFKSGDDGGGSIYYHTPEETDYDILPKIYPVSYIHSGISALGASISFFDDPIFISGLGCTALEKRSVNLERSISARSRNVNQRLLCENLSEISMTRWCGYLVVEAGERIYLADSREKFINDYGYTEYEWYYLSGIGSYQGATRVFKYSEFASPGYISHPAKCHQEAEGEVYLTVTDSGRSVYYTEADGVRYEVYTDGEMRGGKFSPATCVYSTEDNLLFFGTESGDICLFNNDMRGIAPGFISQKADFDADEYKRSHGKRIHPYFYSFDSHAPLYAVKTVSDDGGIPHFTKNTVKGSLTVKMRCLSGKSVSCEVGTEHSGYKEVADLPDAGLDFAEFDFSALSFINRDSATLSVKEREKGWIEKNVSIFTNEYASPFGIYSITYRFTVKGKIKH